MPLWSGVDTGAPSEPPPSPPSPNSPGQVGHCWGEIATVNILFSYVYAVKFLIETPRSRKNSNNKLPPGCRYLINGLRHTHNNKLPPRLSLPHQWPEAHPQQQTSPQAVVTSSMALGTPTTTNFPPGCRYLINGLRHTHNNKLPEDVVTSSMA